MGILNIMPLELVPCSLQVLELVFNVRFPSNVGIVDVNRVRLVFLLKSEGIVEETLGDQAAWEGSFFGFELCYAVRGVYEAQVLVFLDRVAVVELVNGELVAHELLVGARLDVAAMVLIEVV